MKGRMWLVALLVMLPSCSALRGPRYIRQVTIDNPYEYSVSVEVGDGRSGWLNLGGAQRNSENTIQEVIDMGDRWVFRFRYFNTDEQEVSYTRAELIDARWHALVPEALVKRLRAKNELPSYKR